MRPSNAGGAVATLGRSRTPPPLRSALQTQPGNIGQDSWPHGEALSSWSVSRLPCWSW